ncbi:MAG: hypothetical protein ACJ0G8_02730 [Dehalococcoidia bacterium]
MNIKDIIKNNSVLSKLLNVTAEEKFGEIYLVGGFIRDHFLGLKSNDIDLSVQKNASLFSERLAKIFNAKIKHSQFNTYIVTNETIKIDIAGFRKESYLNPGSLPEITYTNKIYDDLLRRDFSINSIASSLKSFDLGEIIDPLNGISDIKNNILRINHKLGFSDDPTRIFRAIRYSNKYNIKIDADTEKYIYKHKKFIKNISGKRIVNELNLLLLENNYSTYFEKLSKYNILDEIHKDFITYFQNEPVYNNENFRIKKIYLLTKNIDNNVANKLEEISTEFSEWSNGIRLNNIYKNIKFEKNISLSELHILLKDFPKEFLIIKQQIEKRVIVKNYITNYINKISKIRMYINGTDLLNIGFQKGPIIGKILDEIYIKKLNDEINSKFDELNYALKIKNQRLP